MKKIIRCSKFNILIDSKGPAVALVLLMLVRIFFEKRNINSFIIYIIGILIILIFINHFLCLHKKVNVKVNVEKLLYDYNQSEYIADEKYEYKYIKLKGIVSNIKFDEKVNILTIELKSNEKYTVDGVASFVTKKCFKYIENVCEGKEVTIYGYFKRISNQIFIDIRYLR